MVAGKSRLASGQGDRERREGGKKSKARAGNKGLGRTELTISSGSPCGKMKTWKGEQPGFLAALCQTVIEGSKAGGKLA